MNLFSPERDKAEKDENRFLFGTVKKLTYKYGIDYILQAFKLFLDKWKENGSVGKVPHMFICGKGENKADFEKLRDELDLQNSVEIKGYIPNNQIPAIMRKFDVFCLGSIVDSESFGVAAVEAMACGLPVISTDVDGFTEVMKDGVTGFVVPRKDITAMADKMWALYENKELRKNMGASGREHVYRMYNWEDNVLELENLLKNVSGKE